MTGLDSEAWIAAAKVRVGYGNPGPLQDAGGGIGVAGVERDVGDLEPIDKRPGGGGPVPTRLHPDGRGHCDADR